MTSSGSSSSRPLAPVLLAALALVSGLRARAEPEAAPQALELPATPSPEAATAAPGSAERAPQPDSQPAQAAAPQEAPPPAPAAEPAEAPKVEPAAAAAEPTEAPARPTAAGGDDPKAAPAPPPTATEPAPAGASPAQDGWRTFEAWPTPSPPPSGPPADQAAPRRIALFPVQNLTGRAAPVKEVAAALRERLVSRGVEVVPDEGVVRVLAQRRVRYTGGLDPGTAAALHDEAGVDGVLIPALEAYGVDPPYRLAMTTRLISTGSEPTIVWSDSFARVGNDAPGLLGLGIVPSVLALRDRALDQAVASLVSVTRPQHPTSPCPELGGRKPNRFFRSPLAADPERRTIAVLPFVNTSGRRDAGEVVALRFVASLAGDGRIRVVEPGVVRAEMLTHRLGAAGAISLDDARVILELLGADLVLSGTVRTFDDTAGSSGAPSVDFSAWALDRDKARLAWSSTSSGTGGDGVYFFGLGRVSTASALACSMAKGVVGLMLSGRPASDVRSVPAGSAPAARLGAWSAPH